MQKTGGIMATPSPAQQIADEIRSLQNKVSELQNDVRLAKVRDAIEDLQTKIGSQPQRVATARGRGYVFENDLEAQAQSYVESWAMLYPNLQMQINQQSTMLMNSLRPIEMQMPQLAAAAGNPFTARGILNTLQSSVSQLESKVSAVESTIRGMYDQFERQVAEFIQRLDQIEYMLTQLAEATFGLLPTEGGIAAVKAVWCKTGKEQKGDPQGVLYLTDQRIIFEQKEEVATKKVLFVATEKQKVQGLQLEAPVALVDNIQTSKAGLFKNEDHIEVRFQPGAPVQSAHFHIWQDCATWQGLINRAKAKDFDKTRAVAVDQAEVAKVKAAPTQCPACGGAITQVVLRGQDTIKCEFCGNVIRL
jgi:outer membrane murein-binding lipoprotein Lpp